MSIVEGGQSAVPVAHREEQDDYWPQDHRGAEGLVHSSQGGCLPVRPHGLLLASFCRGRGCCPGQHIPQEGGAGRNGREPRAGGQHVHLSLEITSVCSVGFSHNYDSFMFIARLK